MLKLLVFLAAIPTLAILPVMYTARAVDAQRTSLWWIISALAIQGVLSKLIDAVVPSALLLFLFSVPAGALVYQLVLETTYKKGLIISIVSSVVFIVGALLLITALGGSFHMKA